MTQVSTGNGHTCAVDSTGAAYCWGLNGNGQLGNNSTTQSQVPVTVNTSGVLAGKTLTQVSVGTAFTCALDRAGAAYCWGLNSSGQLGNNSTAQSLVPVTVFTGGVLSGTVLVQLTAGAAFTCVQDTTGAVYCWGANGSGQLGNNSTAGSSVPVVVQSLPPVRRPG